MSHVIVTVGDKLEIETKNEHGVLIDVQGQTVRIPMQRVRLLVLDPDIDDRQMERKRLELVEADG